MSSSSQTTVNVGGAIRSLSNLGFRDGDLAPEGIDNSRDAGATKISITIDDQQNFILADNAKGMSKKQLETRFVLYNDSDPSREKQGRFGVGNNVMHSLLSGNESVTKSISYGMNPPKKGKGPDTLALYNIELDWPEAVKSNVFPLHASEASVASTEEWNKYAIDKTKSGTIDIIHLCDRTFKYFVENKKEIIANLQRMYSYYLEDNVNITLNILGDVTKLTPMYLTAVSPHTEVSVKRKEGTVARIVKTAKDVREVWAKPDGTLRIYYKDAGKKWVYWGKNKNNKSANIQEYPPNDKAFIKIGPLAIEHAYDPSWDATTIEQLGGIYLRRNRKIIHKLPPPVPSGGDFEEQSAILRSRTIVEFEASKEFDWLFGILVNKSFIVKIHKALEEEFADMHTKFAKDWYKPYKPKKVKADTSPPATPKNGTKAPVTATTQEPAKPVTQAPVKAVVRKVLLSSTATQPTPAQPTPTVIQQLLRPPTPQDADSTSISSEGSADEGGLSRPARQMVLITNRRVPQSEFDLVDAVIKFRESLNTMNLEALRSKASTIAKEDMSRQKDTLVDILETLKKI